MVESVAEFFAGLESKADASKLQGLEATFQFDISGDDGGQWYVTIADGQLAVTEGTAEAPNITFAASAENMLKILAGQLDGQAAFLTGRLRLAGDISLAMKLPSMFKLG